MWRWLLLLLLLLALGLQVKLRYGQGGRQDVADLRVRVQQQQAENRKLDTRNSQLEADVRDLQSGGEAIEERARMELGMIKPGEIFYQVIEEPSSIEKSPAAGDDAP